jgi:hypothetical protein
MISSQSHAAKYSYVAFASLKSEISNRSASAPARFQSLKPIQGCSSLLQFIQTFLAPRGHTSVRSTSCAVRLLNTRKHTFNGEFAKRTQFEKFVNCFISIRNAKNCANLAQKTNPKRTHLYVNSKDSGWAVRSTKPHGPLAGHRTTSRSVWSACGLPPLSAWQRGPRTEIKRANHGNQSEIKPSQTKILSLGGCRHGASDAVTFAKYCQPLPATPPGVFIFSFRPFCQKTPCSPWLHGEFPHIH